MADGKQCTDVLDAAYRTAVLGVRLVGDSIENMDELLDNAFNSTEFQVALRQALQALAEKQVQNTPSTISEKDLRVFVENLGKQGGKIIGLNVLNQVKNSFEFRQLERSAQDVVAAFKCTPMGVWYDRNEKMIYVVAIGAILAGAVAMYVTRSGDALAQQAMPLISEKYFDFVELGQVKLSGQVSQFVPSTRTITARVVASANWEPVKVQIAAAAQAVDTNVQISGTGQIIIPVTSGLGVELKGSVDSNKAAPALALGVNYDANGLQLHLLANIQEGKFASAGATANLTIPENAHRPGLTFGGGANIDRSGKVETMASFSLSWRF